MNRGVATAWELVWLRNKEDNMDDLGRNSKIEVQGGNARVRRKFRMRSYFKKRVASLSNRREIWPSVACPDAIAGHMLSQLH